MPIARAATTALTFTAKLSRELPLRYSRLPLAPFARSPWHNTARGVHRRKYRFRALTIRTMQLKKRREALPFFDRFAYREGTGVARWASSSAYQHRKRTDIAYHSTRRVPIACCSIFLEESNLHLRSAHKVQRGVDFVRVAVVLVRANRRRRATASRCHFP